MAHSFTACNVQRGTTMEFTFEDGSKFVKTYDCERRTLMGGKMRKGGLYFITTKGDRIVADDLYAEMMEAPA